MKKLLLTGAMLVALSTQAQSWVNQATNLPTSYGVDEMVIVDPSTVWITAYDGSGGGTYPKAGSRTVNGGATWTPFNVTGPGANALLSDIAAVSATTAWVVTAPSGSGPNANRMWKTTDGGATWTQQTIGYTAGSFANHVYFWDANNGWTSGDPLGGKFEMFKTSNGGSTWTTVTGALAPLNSDEFTYVGVKEVVGDNIWVGTSIGRILRSSDRGTTWTGSFSPALDFGGVITEGSSASMAFKDASNGLLITVDGAVAGGTPVATLYSTADGGATWQDITPTGPWYFGDVTYVPGTANTYVSTGINSSQESFMGSSYSTDGGNTWIAIDAGMQRGKVQFINPTTGWAGQFSDSPTNTKGILKFSGNLALAVNDAAMKSSLQISPNPAADFVTLKSDKNIEAVSVIDLSGKRVMTVKGSKTLNVSSLAKGTYILQVNYGGGAVENTKLIKK